MTEELRPNAPLDRAFGRGLTVNWELLAWIAIVVLTLLTRLWALGDRAMSHDESLHTYYSWKLFVGEGYTHDPMMHGPLLYHATALSYLLFGASDFTARLLAVVSGLGLVLSPLLVRKWLGPIGALSAGLMLLVSPTVMYYSRYIRHDIPVELFTVLMFVSFIRYVDSRSGRWVVLAGLAGAGAVTSAEMSYINGFVLLSFIGIAMLVERISRRTAYLVEIVFLSVGLGLLLFSSLASAGRFSALDMSEGSPGKIAMQVGFLASGLLLIYGLVSPLLTRPRPVPTGGEVEVGAKLGEILPHALSLSEGRARGSLRAIIAGGVLLVIGLLLLRGPELAPQAAGLARLSGFGALLLGVGWFASLYGVIARLSPRLGRHVDLVSAGIGLVAALSWSAVWFSQGGQQGLIGGPAMGSVTQSALLLLVLGSAMVVLLGLLGWLLAGHEKRGLADAMAAVPLEAVGAGAAVFVVVYILLFTTFFTNAAGIHGFVNSIRYWLEQHDVVRGGQPWYYYGLFTPMYEFVPFFLSLIAVVVYVFGRRLRVGAGNDGDGPDEPSAAAWAFVPNLLVWGAGVFWIYSWAGEKMPWLIVHLVVPMAILGGRLVGDMVRLADWAEMRRRGWMVAGLAVLAVLAVGRWLTVSPFGGQTQEALAQASGFLIGIPVVALLLWGLWLLARDMPRRQAWLAAAFGALLVAFVLNTRYSLLANFENDELAVEYIVYAHGTPDDKHVYNTLLDMQQRLGVETPLTVGYDNEVSWPFTWYFRHTDWPGAVYLGEKPSSALSQDVVLVGSPNYGNFGPYLRDRYVDIEYRRMWWPNEGYKGLTPGKVWSSMRDPKAWRNVRDILLYRKYTLDPQADNPEPKPLTDWYHHANMKLYVKRDLIEKLWPLVEARPDWLPEVVPEEKVTTRSLEVTIDQTFDSGPDGTPIVAPKGIALGPDGILYVVDHGNDRIVSFGTDGEAQAVIAAGDLTYTGGDGRPDHSAWGVGVGPDGAVYVADTWNHRVVKYVDGRRTASFGAFGNPASPTEDLGLLFGPRDIAIARDGSVFVTDTGNDRIVVLTPDLEPVRGFGGSGLEAGRFDEPTSIAFDPETGDLFVADLWNFRIQRLDESLQPIGEWPVDGWDSQEAAHKAYIAVGPGGIVVASDPYGQRVWVFDRTGTVIGALDLPADPRGLDQPIGIAVDEQGRIHVASSNSGVVTRYAPLADTSPSPAAGSASPEGEEGSPDSDQPEDAVEEPGGETEADEAGGGAGDEGSGAGSEGSDDSGAPPAATGGGDGSGAAPNPQPGAP